MLNTTRQNCYREYRLALKEGVLSPQPCEVCGSPFNPQGHHEDYKHPLEVNWLCPSHHQLRHRILSGHPPSSNTREDALAILEEIEKSKK